MCIPVSYNEVNYLNYPKCNSNNTQETVSNYTKNTDTLPQQKNLNDYTINTEKEHKLKKLTAFLFTAIKYFVCMAFFPITIIVLVIIKLTSSKSNESTLVESSINEKSMEDAYNQMFNSRRFNDMKMSKSSLFSEIKEIQNNNIMAIEKRDFLSKLFIKDIEDELGEISEEEQQIIEAIKALPSFKFQHQSYQKLVNNNTLTIYSRDKVALINTNKKIGLANSWADANIKNTDFVFFSVDFSGSSIETPPTIITHARIFYGTNSYVIPENIIGKNGYFTLVDHATGLIDLHNGITTNVFYDNDMTALSWLFAQCASRIKSSKYSLTPMFSPEDIRLGMALYIIKALRQVDNAINDPKVIADYQADINTTARNYRKVANASEAYKVARDILLNQRAKFMKYLLERTENQNQLLNAILNLEYHAPVVVKLNPGEYAEHKVADLT